MRIYCILLCLICVGCLDADDIESYLAYQATVEGQELVSTGFPAGTIRFDSSLVYVGSDSFILYDIARCEIHLFAEADENKQVNRLYWIQYEGYLPSLMPRSYDYSGEPFRTEIGGKTFYDSVNYYNVENSMPDWREDSDIMHVFMLLEREGYQLKEDVMRVRLVHLDEGEKNELMVIYIEPMKNAGTTIEQLGPDGKRSETWYEVSDALRDRALADMAVSFN